eukprot:CAMPEP_0117437242 /NCGR_PEP_ID=MMETSP0759-20121206/1423_1 /TAXON_ID=63605 /ORGANISM="Percolomonas cosmopolitus, Strain WS" /LENGTH=639 /DNA_ID=CAMNT_0005228869 /DNA_START=173 /DNA_END=2092 /DNA_ORIENTATION=+
MAKTELIKDDLNPKFVTPLTVDYHFEQQQPVKLVVYDIDTKDESLDKADLVGSIQFDLAELASAKGMVLKRNLQGFGKHSGKRTGTIIVRAENQSQNNDDVHFKISAKKLDKKDLFSSDPYLKIHRKSQQTGEWLLVHQSETIKKNLSPKWASFTLPARNLCHGDYNSTLKFDVFDWDKRSNDDLIGEIEMSVNQLLQRRGQLIQINNRNKKRGNSCGSLIFEKIEIVRRYTFMDYLRGGLEMGMMTAIDFTGSNGNPNTPQSLHYKDPSGRQPNQYLQAIHAIGDIISYYDNDKRFPCFGFGARLPTPHGPVLSHCFALNGNANDPSCDGIQGIVSAYEQALHSVQLYGPTFFSEIIRKASDLTSGYVSQDVQQYHVLLLLTDGLVNDMDKTVEEICRASTLPLSIIIVGVGNADFSKMDFLDSDDGKLRSNSTGRVAQRDIVQFVPFNRFKHNPHAFASAVLAELPHQVEEYFKVKGISPNQACVVDVNDIQITEGAMGSGLPDFQPFNQGSQQQGQQQMYPQQPQQSYNQQGQYQQQNYNQQGQYQQQNYNQQQGPHISQQGGHPQQNFKQQNYNYQGPPQQQNYNHQGQYPPQQGGQHQQQNFSQQQNYNHQGPPQQNILHGAPQSQFYNNPHGQ